MAKYFKVLANKTYFHRPDIYHYAEIGSIVMQVSSRILKRTSRNIHHARKVLGKHVILCKKIPLKGPIEPNSLQWIKKSHLKPIKKKELMAEYL
jgi:hypothetical protein